VVDLSERSSDSPAEPVDVDALLPIVRRVVRARVSNPDDAEDAVQETMTRVLEAQDRIADGMIEPYAISTARNLVATMWRDGDRRRRRQHLLQDVDVPPAPEERVIADEDVDAMSRALARFREEDRALLLAHEAQGRSTKDIAAISGSTAGAVAARLHRLRARLRMEYLLAVESTEPPRPQCRTVLHALSTRDRRRQREADADGHLVECDFCARVGRPLLHLDDRGEDVVRIRVRVDADIVVVRQATRELAGRAGFPKTELTVLTTAVSEIARNTVRYAGTGEVVVELVQGERRPGIRVTARDAGPGIPDVERALQDGYSTSNSMGLGLPGTRRLMDEFDVVTRPGRGTTIVMTKWLPAA
jgi:serine/threonine-protein kinase RsbT